MEDEDDVANLINPTSVVDTQARACSTFIIK